MITQKQAMEIAGERLRDAGIAGLSLVAAAENRLAAWRVGLVKDDLEVGSIYISYYSGTINEFLSTDLTYLGDYSEQRHEHD